MYTNGKTLGQFSFQNCYFQFENYPDVLYVHLKNKMVHQKHNAKNANNAFSFIYIEIQFYLFILKVG